MEKKVLINFIVEFSPYYVKEEIKDFTYEELVSIAKEVANDL